MKRLNLSQRYGVLLVRTLVVLGAALLIAGCESAPLNPAPTDPALIKAGDDALKKRDEQMAAKAKHKP